MHGLFPPRAWLGWLVATLTTTSVASAHHSPGHGPGETLRALGSMGTNAAPRQRTALIADFGRTSAEPTLNTATVGSLSLLVDVRLGDRLYLGGLLPFAGLQEDLSSEPKFGLGDLRLSSQFALGDVHDNRAASWAVSLSLSIPTRTISYEVDPGRQWTLSPGVRYADKRGRFLWYALAFTPVNIRPSGWALDLSAAAGVGYRLLPNLALSAGPSAAIRLLNLCSVNGTLDACAEGRDSELNREVGATRVYATVSLSADLARDWSLMASLQLPLTPRRDVEWLTSVGLEFRF